MVTRGERLFSTDRNPSPALAVQPFIACYSYSAKCGGGGQCGQMETKMSKEY